MPGPNSERELKPQRLEVPDVGEDIIIRPTVTAPELMPALPRGKHRNPRQGACFMEMVSFWAGQR